MLHRVLSVCVGVVMLTLVGGCSQPTTETHKGKVVKVEGSQLTMTDMAGEREHAHEVPPAAALTCGGQTCTLTDLKAGFTVTVTTEEKDKQMVVTKIEVQEAKS